MSLITIVFISLGLAMDAFAVSITSGIAIKKLKVQHALKIAVFFGFFQSLMPLIGWMSGCMFKTYIQTYNHWVVFGLLAVIGGKMIYESFKMEDENSLIDPLKIMVLLVLAIAVSLDALAIGISFSLMHVSVFFPIVMIGVITFIMSLVGVYIGDHVGHLFEGKIEIIGGLILIGIGVKILLENLLN